jgi:hypothetical protein
MKRKNRKQKKHKELVYKKLSIHLLKQLKPLKRPISLHHHQSTQQPTKLQQLTGQTQQHHPEWKKTHPHHRDSNTTRNKQSTEIVIQTE